MLLLSQIKGKRVVDAGNQRVGRVQDVIAAGDEPFPHVTGLVLGRRGRRFLVDWEEVESLAPVIRLKRVWSDADATPPAETALHLARDVMDQQIFDTRQIKLVRVNDVTLVPGDGTLLVAGVDASLRGLLRRVRLERVGAAVARALRRRLPRHLIGWNQVEVLQTEQGGVVKLKVPLERLKRLHPRDLAALVNQMDPAERAEVFQSLDVETAAEALPEVEPEVQVSIIASLEDEHAADILSEMEPDEAADLLGDLPAELSEDLLEKMDETEAGEVKELLGYADDTAGGIMTNWFAAVPVTLTAREVIHSLRVQGPIDHGMYYVYVLNEREQLLGVFTLGTLITALPEAEVAQFMQADPIRVRADASVAEVAQVLARYNLLAVPVTAHDDVLLGIATIDDVIDLVLPAEAKQSLPRIFGSSTGAVRARAEK